MTQRKNIAETLQQDVQLVEAAKDNAQALDVYTQELATIRECIHAVRDMKSEVKTLRQEWSQCGSQGLSEEAKKRIEETFDKIVHKEMDMLERESRYIEQKTFDDKIVLPNYTVWATFVVMLWQFLFLIAILFYNAIYLGNGYIWAAVGLEIAVIGLTIGIAIRLRR